jgi:HSP20 family protein
MTNDNQIHVSREGNSLPVRRRDPLPLKARPVADIYETPETFVVSLDLPGASKANIEVSVEPGLLFVRGTVTPRQETSGRLLHKEIGWNQYEREFKIGPGVDENKITAEFSDGVLTVTLPKSEEAKVRHIQIT